MKKNPDVINWNYPLNFKQIFKGYEIQCMSHSNSVVKDNNQFHYSDCLPLSFNQVSTQAQPRQSPLFRWGCQHKVQWPDPCREQQPNWETLRNLRFTGAVATFVFYTPSCKVSVCKNSLFVFINCVFVIYVYLSMSTHSSPWIPQEFSFAFLAVQCVVSVHNVVSFLCNSPECVWPAKLIRHSYRNAHGEMRH